MGGPTTRINNPAARQDRTPSCGIRRSARRQSSGQPAAATPRTTYERKPVSNSMPAINPVKRFGSSNAGLTGSEVRVVMTRISHGARATAVRTVRPKTLIASRRRSPRRTATARAITPTSPTNKVPK